MQEGTVTIPIEYFDRLREIEHKQPSIQIDYNIFNDPIQICIKKKMML